MLSKDVSQLTENDLWISQMQPRCPRFNFILSMNCNGIMTLIVMKRNYVQIMTPYSVWKTNELSQARLICISIKVASREVWYCVSKYPGKKMMYSMKTMQYGHTDICWFIHSFPWQTLIVQHILCHALCWALEIVNKKKNPFLYLYQADNLIGKAINKWMYR